MFLCCTVAAPSKAVSRAGAALSSPSESHQGVRSVNPRFCRSENGGSKRSSGFIRPQRVSLLELKAGAWHGGERFVQPDPGKSSRALISHFILLLTLSLAIFAFLKGASRLVGVAPTSLAVGVSASCGGVRRLPKSHRDVSSKRHLWAILASTARVITISNYAEICAFGAYYSHQRGVLFLFSPCSLA